MKFTFILLKSFVLLILTAGLLSSCANIIPPSGGAKDSLPPMLIKAFPKDSSTNFTAKKIVLTFDEYVEAKDIQQNFIINPLPTNQPNVEYKLNNVFVTLKDTLEPNTTYSINFGNAIKDVNEGNIAKNKTYTFSTGKSIDNNTIKGNIIVAKDGKVDSTLIVVLHTNLADSAVKKLNPKYLTKLDGQGKFEFVNLPAAAFNVFVLTNDYNKKYDDSTKLFGFLNEPVIANTTTQNHTLYVYKEVESVKQNSPQKTEATDKKEDKKLRYSINLSNNKFDILDSSLKINFNRNILLKNSDSVILLDTNYKKIDGFTVVADSIKTGIIVKAPFGLSTPYVLLIHKTAIADTTGITLSKSDTVRFSSFKQEDYGNVKLRINTVVENGVLQIFKDDKLLLSAPVASKEIKYNLFKPGEYELRILIDENKNNIWDAGNYKQKKQPEKVIPIKNKLVVRANWDNEIDIAW